MQSCVAWCLELLQSSCGYVQSRPYHPKDSEVHKWKTLWSLVVFYSAFCSCAKTLQPKATREKKGLTSTYTSRSQSIIEGSSQELKQELNGSMLLTDLFCGLLSTNFLAQTHLPRDRAAQAVQASHINHPSRYSHRQGHRPIWSRIFLSRGSYFPSDSGLYQMDSKTHQPRCLHWATVLMSVILNRKHSYKLSQFNEDPCTFLLNLPLWIQKIWKIGKERVLRRRFPHEVQCPSRSAILMQCALSKETWF